jgi:dTDP-4-amino-4,6-dideoxygalactose transaminase
VIVPSFTFCSTASAFCLRGATPVFVDCRPDTVKPRRAPRAGRDHYLLMPDLAHRRGLLAHLAARGISGAFHYQPLHSAPAGLRYGRTAGGGCPVTDDIADRLIRLPLFAGITTAELHRVIDAIQTYPMTAGEVWQERIPPS